LDFGEGVLVEGKVEKRMKVESEKEGRERKALETQKEQLKILL